MFKRVLVHIRNRIKRKQYVVTLHARKEMNDEQLAILEVERAILNGKIVERQRDHATGESKYRIYGKTGSGAAVETVVKFGPTDKIVIITVYRA